MYPVLEFLMKKNNITKEQIAEFLNSGYSTILNKFSGKNEWKYGECEKIKEHYFPEYKIEDLFKKEIF